MTPEQRRSNANDILASIDWDTYDYTTAPGADMSFPDYPDEEHNRPVWLSKHYNSTTNMRTCHVTDLNEIQDGFKRRLMALYGVPVEWTGDEKSEYQERLAKLDQAKAAGAELFGQWLDYYGIVNEEHLEFMRDRITGRLNAKSRAEEQAKINVVIDQTKQDHAKQVAVIHGTGELDPFMGIPLETWAQAQAAVTSGTTMEQILPSLGIDETTWLLVSAEWNARMSRDTTATIATVYGQAFVSAGAGQFGAAGQATSAAMNPGGKVDGNQAPVPMDRWIEITVAQSAASERGEDPAALLAQFGITPQDWGTIGGWWGQHFGANAMELMAEYDQLTAKYEQKYGVGHGDGLTSDEREEETIQDILKMGQVGRSGDMLPFLQQRFPEDAQDMDALDWWLDRACDYCEAKDKKQIAQVILQARYPLQEDEDEPLETWIQSKMESMFG